MQRPNIKANFTCKIDFAMDAAGQIFDVMTSFLTGGVSRDYRFIFMEAAAFPHFMKLFRIFGGVLNTEGLFSIAKQTI